LCCLTTFAHAQEKPQAYIGAKIIPITSPEIPNGILVVEHGKITAVGAVGAVTLPANAERHEAKGLVLMPGLIDTHSHIGSPAGGDSSAPIQPDVRVLDAINV